MAKVLLTSSLDTPFILEDLRILRKHHEVQHFTTRGAGSLISVLPALLKSDLCFIWFASTYSFWISSVARILGKPSLIVVGGVDAAKIPEIRYGIWLNPWKALLVGRAVRSASKVLVVAPSLKQRLAELARYDAANAVWVPTGYDPNFWTASGEKEPLVLTVANCADVPRLYAKGIDLLVEIATRLSDVEFLLVGTEDRLLREAGLTRPRNLRLLPILNRQHIRECYRRARVYFLPSMTEGMPNSVCEAMLCECVPVAADVGGVPEILGDGNYLVQREDKDRMAECVRLALGSPAAEGKKARERIASLYPSSRREQELMQHITEVLQ